MSSKIEELAQARRRHELRELEEAAPEPEALVPGTGSEDPWTPVSSFMAGPSGMTHPCLREERVTHLQVWRSPDGLLEQVRAATQGGAQYDFFRILGLRDRYETEEGARAAMVSAEPAGSSLEDFKRWAPVLRDEDLVIVDTCDGLKVRGWITAFRYAIREHPATIGFLPLERGSDTAIPWISIARVHRMAEREIAKARREGYPTTLSDRIQQLSTTEKRPA